jgi:MYXO-CTERM domain-containing protein
MAVLAAPVYGDTVDNIIFGNPDPTIVGGFVSDRDGNFQQELDDFALQVGANTITDLHWWGFYNGYNGYAAYDDFTIKIYKESNGKPNMYSYVTLDASSVMRTNTGEDAPSGPGDLYEYWLDIDALELEAGETYYLSILNDTDNDYDSWSWATQSGYGDHWYRQDWFGNWILSSTPIDMAFYITGPGTTSVVPVPQSAALGLLGFAIVGVLRRRTRNNA